MQSLHYLDEILIFLVNGLRLISADFLRKKMLNI